MSSVASSIAKKEFYTVGEVAQLLEFSPDKVRSLCNKSKLDCDRGGPNNNRRIKHASLVAMMTDLGKPLGDLADEGDTAPEASSPNDVGNGAPPPGDGANR